MRRAALLAVLVLVLSACTRSQAPQSVLPPPVPTSGTTQPPVSTSVLSYDVPPEITAGYVEHVMRALDAVYGDAIRIIVRTRSFDDAFLKRLLAIYTAEEFEFQQGIWARDLRMGLQNRPAVPGNPATTVTRMLRSGSGCIVAAVTRDFSATITRAEKETPQHYVALVPKRPNRDPLNVNHTPWVLAFDGWMEDGSEPEGRCAA